MAENDDEDDVTSNQSLNEEKDGIPTESGTPRLDGNEVVKRTSFYFNPSHKICGISYWWWPTYEDLLWKVSIMIMFLLVWGAVYVSVGPLAGPGGGLFNAGVILMVAYYASVLGSYLALPPLIGMLMVGVFFRNTGLLEISGLIDEEILSKTRCLALTLLLIRAGLGLDPGALKKLSMVVPRLAFIPCIVEAITEAVSSYFILGLPLQWGFLLGSVVGAVSPAVTVHYLLALKEKGYGEDKGIATLVIASSSIDDILAITLFGIVSAVIFSSGSVAMKAGRGPLEAIIGVICGVLLGVVVIYLPHDKTDHVVFYRSLILASGNYFAVLGSRRFEMTGAGYMAAITSSFIASYVWRKRNWLDGGKPVQHGFSVAWQVVQVSLFSLIGYELDLRRMNWYDSALQISVLAIGLIMRMATTFTVIFGTGFNLKEHLFIMIAWIPKATVQAALGPTALDLVKRFQRSSTEREYAEIILNMAILGILIAAPLGALGILFTGPRLLSQVPKEHLPESIPLPVPQPEDWRKGLFSRCFPRKKPRERTTMYELHKNSILLTADNLSKHRYV